MSISEFSLELAIELSESVELFPVDLDDAWKWIGYSRKDKCLEMLKSNFIQGVDFLFLEKLHEKVDQPSRENKYGLTIEAFKMLGMMTSTSKGREIREYFLECEKRAKAANVAPIEPEPLRMRDNLRITQANLVNRLNEILMSGGSHEEINAVTNGLDVVRKTIGELQEPIESNPVASVKPTATNPIEHAIADFIYDRITITNHSSDFLTTHQLCEAFQKIESVLTFSRQFRKVLYLLHPQLKAMQHPNNQKRIGKNVETVVVGIQFS